MAIPEIPANDPPSPPLKRVDTRIFEVQVQLQNKIRSTGWPLLPQTNWCKIAVDTIKARNAKNQPLNVNIVENSQDSRQWHLQLPEKDYKISFSVMVFSSVLNSSAASTIPWPESWDESKSIYLKPSRFIQSNDAVFKDAVAENGDPRSVSIHIAAKVLIRYCLNNIESNGQYTHVKNSITTGIDVKGARTAVRNGKGSASDLVCVCVATLRAAGIPARPVVGVTNADAVGNVKIAPQYMVWGEYALPGAGWVPFVPKRMRGTVNGLTHAEPWQGLGTLPWLNRRIPLAYNFNCYDVDRGIQNIQMNFISSPN